MSTLQSLNHNAVRRQPFTCSECGEKKAEREGYAVWGTEQRKVCYACCAKVEWDQMQKLGKVTLYLDEPRGCNCTTGNLAVVNWPGTLRFPVRKRTVGDHNITGMRTDIWFVDKDGRWWHGVKYGEHTDLVHCRRAKDKRTAS